MFTMIFACDTNGAIGKDGDLPWRQSSDLQHFKQVTMSKTIVMGRKTWDSLPKALPGRRNIVMSRTPREDVEVLDYDAYGTSDPIGRFALPFLALSDRKLMRRWFVLKDQVRPVWKAI